MPLKSNVSALQRSMKKSLPRTLASGCAPDARAGRQPRTSIHSSIGVSLYGALREVRLPLPGSLRASSQQASNKVFLAARFGTDRQPLGSTEQYTLARLRSTGNTNAGLT